ncbi:hypothetical protein D3C85_1372900 [compost metagenome]
MRLLDLVEQHDGIGLPPDGLGQHPAFAIADVTGRGAKQARHRVPFLELGHIDRGQELPAAKQRVRQGQRRLGLAHAAGAHQQERTQRRAGPTQVRGGGQQVFVYAVDGNVLAFDAFAQHGGQLRQAFHLATVDGGGGDAGPVGNDLCNLFMPHIVVQQGAFALQVG